MERREKVRYSPNDSAMDAPIFYTFRRCPYAMRARMCVDAAGVQVEYREIKLAAKPPELLEASAKGTVPVVVLPSGVVLDESRDIMRWALECCDPEAWLAPENLHDGMQILDIIDGPFKQHLDRYKYSTRYSDADPDVERAFAVDCLRPFEARLERHPYLCGARARIADVGSFPFVRQFASVEPERFAAEFPALERWRKQWQSSERFSRIMLKRKLYISNDCPG